MSMSLKNHYINHAVIYSQSLCFFIYNMYTSLYHNYYVVYLLTILHHGSYVLSPGPTSISFTDPNGKPAVLVFK